MVVALKGGWGEGKTRFWKDTFSGRPDNAPGYVSVFGAESLAAIQKAVIAESLRTRPKNGISGGLYKAIEKTYPFRESAKAILNALGGTVGLTTDVFSVPIDVLQRATLRERWVICLDDIERLLASIDLDMLFGYISALRDEYKVNVVLICNEQRMEERTRDLQRYAEKAVDREIAFAPSIKEIVALVFRDSIAEDALVELARRCQVLGLRNIRILHRLNSYYEEVASSLPRPADPKCLRGILWSLLLFAWAKHARLDAEKITLRFLELYDGTWHELAEDDAEEGQDEDRHKQMLKDYPYRFTDDLDRVLIRFVDSSLLDVESLLLLYEQFLLEARRERAAQRLDEAWAIFHSSFADRDVEFGDAVYKVVREEMDFLPLVRIDGVMSQLEWMRRDGDARALLELVRRLPSERLVKYDDTISRLEYAPLKELVGEEKRKAAIDNRPIAAVIASALEDELIQLRDRKRLADFSESDFFTYFSSTDSPRLTLQLRNLVRGTSGRGDDVYDKAINPILWRVAQRLARSGSALNLQRIKAMELLKPDPSKSESQG